MHRTDVDGVCLRMVERIVEREDTGHDDFFMHALPGWFESTEVMSVTPLTPAEVHIELGCEQKTWYPRPARYVGCNLQNQRAG